MCKKESGPSGIHNDCKVLLRARNIIFFDTSSKNKSLEGDGFPDLTLILENSLFVGVEIKTPEGQGLTKGRLRATQITMAERLRAVNGIYMTVTSREELEYKLKKLQNIIDSGAKTYMVGEFFNQIPFEESKSYMDSI